MRSAAGVIGFPGPASSSTFPPGPAVSTARRPPRAFAHGLFPRGLRSPTESSVPCPPPVSPPSAPSLGFAFPLRGVTGRRPCYEAPTPRSLSVLGVSHARDGLLRHPASWVCFTPQPRPGFTLQGVAPRQQPHRLVGDAVPSRRWRRAAAGVATGATSRRPALRALSPLSSPPSPRRGLATASTRSPRGLRLLQVLPLDVVRTPSRPLPLVAFARAGQDPAALAFSSCRRRARHPLARLPTCPRFSPAVRRFLSSATSDEASAHPPGGPTEPPTVFGLNHFALHVPAVRASVKSSH